MINSANNETVVSVPKLAADISGRDVWNFFQLAVSELRHAGYSELQLSKLFDIKSGLGRMLTDEEYYLEHYCNPFAEAVRDIFQTRQNPRILDVCCGTGAQSLFFALLGATVVSIDYDEGQLDTLQRRIGYYSGWTGRNLQIDLLKGDVRSFDFEALGKFDAVYSHGGIGHFETAEGIFRRLSPALARGGLLILKNGNPDCVWLKVVGIAPRLSARAEYRKEARRHGFEIVREHGASGLPRQLWRVGRASVLLSRFLTSFLPCQLGICYTFRKLTDG